MADTLRWRYQQLTKASGPWTSSEVFEGDYRKAVQGVVGGALLGEPRAAVEEGTGRVIYAVDDKGNATALAVKLFGTIELAGGRPGETAASKKPGMKR